MLHLGCVDEHLTDVRAGTGDLLHEELAHVASELTGVDISAAGIARMAELVPGCYVTGDVEELDQLDLPEVDIVIAAELIEHLGSPSAFLGGLRRYLIRTGAHAIITTPNAYSWRHFASVLLRHREMVHPDHRMLYSRATLLRSLDQAGLVVDRLLVHTWRDQRGMTSRAAALLDGLLLRWEPQLGVGLVAEVHAAPL